MQSECRCEMLCLCAWEWLREGVCGHVLGGTVDESNGPIFDNIADEMIADINMFHACMKLAIRMGDHDGRLIVDVKRCRVLKGTKDLANKLT